MTAKPTKIFPIASLTSDLPTNLIPTSCSENSASGRLIIVGDVHGMRKSLEALLNKVDFNKSNGDHLIFVGDLVNKGPDSPGVIDLAMKLGASAVRGNHENAVLNAAAQIKAAKETPTSSEDPSNLTVPGDREANRSSETISDAEIPEKAPSPATQSTALALSTHQLDWLATLPLILRIKLPPRPVSSLGDSLVVVHAGLVPGVPLEEQDPHALMHLRSLESTSDKEVSFKPLEVPGEESWVGEWDRWQNGLASKTTVIFGHDAKRRLQLGRYAIGLDSACLYGHRLSAVVISVSEGGIEHEVVQVECADVHLVV